MHKIYTNADIYDKYKDAYNTLGQNTHYDCAFICVPTPSNEDGSCDCSEVEEAVMETEADVIIIKSTVPPNTTKRLRQKTGKKVVFSPEYFGETQHANSVDYDFVILGGYKKERSKAVQIIQHYHSANIRIIQMDSTTAELTKYMENAFLATKVVFSNEFYRIAKELGVDYTELREGFIADPRVNPSHTFVYEDQPYYDSKCLNKDVSAILHFTEKHNPSFIKSVIDTNEIFKNENR